MSNDPRHQGPFVQDSSGPGLLRRLLGGGASPDPTAPHAHDEPSTRSVHVPTTGTDGGRRGHGSNTARSVTTTASSGSGRQASTKRRPILVSIIAWLFRVFGWRIVVAAFAGLLVLVGTVFENDARMDATTSRLEQSQRELEEITGDLGEINDMTGTFSSKGDGTSSLDAAAAGVRPRALLVERVAGGELFAEDVRLGKVVLRVERPEVQRALQQFVGERIIVHMQVASDGQSYAVGVTAPGVIIEPVPVEG